VFQNGGGDGCGWLVIWRRNKKMKRVDIKLEDEVTEGPLCKIWQNLLTYCATPAYQWALLVTIHVTGTISGHCKQPTQYQ
jgi:hypothetical protein